MKKLILSVFFVSALLLGSYKETYALPIIDQFQAAIGVVDNLSKFSDHGVLWLINALIYNISGTDPSQLAADVPNANALAFAAGATTTLAFNPPPIHAKDYILNKVLADNLLSTKITFAKTGGESLKGCATLLGVSSCPFYDLWKNVRNAALAFFVLFIIIVGLMVMTRYQTDPRTTVEAVTFVPKMAVSLLLISFSWVIAGLIVDISRVFANLFGIGIFGIVSPGTALMSSFINGFKLEGWLLAGIVTLGIAWVIPLVVYLIFLVIGIIAFIMLLFELLKQYVTIILLAIFSPLAFLWGTLPGQEDTTNSWFKHMLVSALTFPAVAMLLGVAQRMMLVSNIDVPDEFQSGAFAIISVVNWLPFAGSLMAIVLVMMCTKVPAIIEDLLEVKTPGGRAGMQAGKVLSGLPFIGKAFK